MDKFNRLFNTNTTKVKINGEWYKVKEIHETRQWIRVEGLAGSFQRNHISQFSNKNISGNQKQKHGMGDLYMAGVKGKSGTGRMIMGFTLECERCGKRFPNDKIQFLGPGAGIPLCQNCYQTRKEQADSGGCVGCGGNDYTNTDDGLICNICGEFEPF